MICNGKIYTAILTLGLCAACSQAPEKHVDLRIDLPETFSNSGHSMSQEEWWRDFNDPELNALMQLAFADNLNLRIIVRR
jgi:outer membrane protein TolC